jgi:glycosyltransferase 2 family protein
MERVRHITGSMWFRISVSAGLLLALLAMLDVHLIGSALVHASPVVVLALLAAVYGERLYSALRWHQVLRWSGAAVPLPTVVRITFVSAFAGLFLPGVVGTETFRVLGLGKYSGNLAMALSSVLVDRLLAVMTLIPLVLVGLAFAPPGMPEGIRLTAWAALGGTGLAAFMLLHRGPRLLLDRLMPHRLGVRVRPRLERLYTALDTYRSRPAMFMMAVGLALGFQLMRVLVVWLATMAVGIEVPAAYYFIFAPIIALLTMAPISFGGIGVREGAFVYLFSLIGIPAEQAFAASVLVQFIGLLSCLPGALLYVRRAKARSEAREVRLCVRA